MDMMANSLSTAPLAIPPKTAMVFVRDRDSEGVIRQCLSDLAVPNPEFTNANIDAAVNVFRERHSPRLLIVDVQGFEDPIAHVRELANVCEPGTGVIVVGDRNDIRVYRDLKAAGVTEYYVKPLVRTQLVQTCHAILTGNTDESPSRTGKLVFVVSLRGGSGATTIAAATAWHLAEVSKRRVGLIDLDLQYGDCALQLDVAPSHALREALDHPERIDELFLERAMIKVGERMGLLAGLEAIDSLVMLNETAVLTLLEHMLRRYRYVIVDIPAEITPQIMNDLHLPGTVVLVSSGNLVSARDVARWRQKLGPNSAERLTIHVINKGGSIGDLSQAEFTRAVGYPPDIVIPHSRDIATASRLGVRGLLKCPPFQKALQPLLRQLAGEELSSRPKFSFLSMFTRK